MDGGSSINPEYHSEIGQRALDEAQREAELGFAVDWKEKTDKFDENLGTNALKKDP